MRGSASNALPGRRMNCHIGHLDAIRLGTDPEHWAEKHVVEDAQDGDRGRGHVKLSDLAQRSPRVSATRPGARSWPSSDGQERLVHEAVGPCATGARWVRKPAAKEAGCCWPRGACPCHPRSRSHPRSVVRGRWRSLCTQRSSLLRSASAEGTGLPAPSAILHCMIPAGAGR